MMEELRPCGMDPGLLQAYLDGEIAGSDLDRVREHLAGCRECRAEEASFHALFARLSSLPLFAPAPEFDHAVLSAVLPGRNRFLGISPMGWFAGAYVGFTGALAGVALTLAGAPEGLGPFPALTRLWHDSLHLGLKAAEDVNLATHLIEHCFSAAGVVLAQLGGALQVLLMASATPEGRVYAALSAGTALAFFLLARRSPKEGPVHARV